MEVLFKNFLNDQIFGLNGLVNLSNFSFLLAFSVRDFLKLRILSFASDIVILPYYYFQHEPLWPPIFWGMTFIVVNGVRIVNLTLDRRPVILSDREEELHRVAFSSIDKRDFLKLACLARWVDCLPGAMIVKKGQQISDAIVLIAGEAEAVLGSKAILTYHPGQLIGNVSAYSGLVIPLDVVAQGSVKLAIWNLEHMREFTESRPELRANLLQIMSTDLAVKLHESLSFEQTQSELFLIGANQTVASLGTLGEMED
jgi:CRP-like cAMP-binding protein